jgi:type IV pilus biogenesis protein PilP
MINVKTALLTILTLAFATSATYAQFAPGSQMAASGDEPPAQAPSLQTVVEDTNPLDTVDDIPIANDVCPEPKKAMGNTPDDLAKIQEDITRFTLCVQRAQLLERLNELAEANIDTIDTALNLTVEQQAGNAVPGIMPSVPIPQLSESAAQMLENDMAESAPSYAPAPMRPMESSWRIRNIEGSGGSIRAQLMHADGTILRVSQGETLPDDAGRVISITNTGVRIERDGQKQTLQWTE